MSYKNKYSILGVSKVMKLPSGGIWCSDKTSFLRVFIRAFAIYMESGWSAYWIIQIKMWCLDCVLYCHDTSLWQHMASTETESFMTAVYDST